MSRMLYVMRSASRREMPNASARLRLVNGRGKVGREQSKVIHWPVKDPAIQHRHQLPIRD